MKKLQVNIGGSWEYVFCRNELKATPITTKSYKRALGADALEYFKGKFGNLQFRVHSFKVSEIK